MRGVAVLVFARAGSFLFCDIFNENADRTKTDLFSQQETNLKDAIRNKQLKV